MPGRRSWRFGSLRSCHESGSVGSRIPSRRVMSLPFLGSASRSEPARPWHGWHPKSARAGYWICLRPGCPMLHKGAHQGRWAENPSVRASNSLIQQCGIELLSRDKSLTCSGPPRSGSALCQRKHHIGTGGQLADP